MKTLVLLSAVALAAVFLPGKAAAASVGPLILNASGTIVLQKTMDNHTSSQTNIDTTSTLSFNEKYIYNIVSNAVASTNFPYLTPTNLPADGYIAFAPTNGALNKDVAAGDYYSMGLFYVTNKSGFHFPLSGYDHETNYYSYVELDDDDVGFFDNFLGAYSGSESPKTRIGTYTETEASVLYIHDDPYDFDDGDNPDVVLGLDNFNAIEIRSTLKAVWLIEGPDIDLELANTSDASSGGATGSADINGQEDAAVTSGHVSLSP
jgi:hypothetical protein